MVLKAGASDESEESEGTNELGGSTDERGPSLDPEVGSFTDEALASASRQHSIMGHFPRSRK